MKFWSGIIFCALVFASCATKFGKVVKSKDKEYKLKMAEQYYATKHYDKAQQLYTDLMPLFKGDPRFEDIYYKYAYTSYYLKDYENAENLFKTYSENFPNNSKVEECDYMRCICYYKQSPKLELEQVNTIKAMGMMQVFINTHPGSERNKKAADIIDVCRGKLELKDYRGAKLYYDMGQYRAAGVAFTTLLNGYPESPKADEYKLMIIKSYYQYAEMSIEEKKYERYEKVIDECEDFTDRFPDSKLKKEADYYLNLSKSIIKI